MHFDVVRNAEARQIDAILASRAHTFDQIRLVDPKPHALESRGKKDLLKIVRSVSDLINVSYVRQKEALGLGHAVLRARELVGDEPFAVVLADDVIDSEVPCIRQLP